MGEGIQVRGDQWKLSLGLLGARIGDEAGPIGLEQRLPVTAIGHAAAEVQTR